MEQLKSHVPFIREMISNVKTVEYRRKWENMLNMIVSNEKLSANQIEIISQNISKAKQFKQQYANKTPPPVAEQQNDSQQKVKQTAPATNAVRKTVRDPEKRRMNEMKRLHENIVKDEIIPSKRVSKRASFNDYLEDKDLIIRRRKTEMVMMVKKAETKVEQPAGSSETQKVVKRLSLPTKAPTEFENVVKKVRLDGKLMSVVMENEKNAEIAKQEGLQLGKKIHLDGKPARIVHEATDGEKRILIRKIHTKNLPANNNNVNKEKEKEEEEEKKQDDDQVAKIPKIFPKKVIINQKESQNKKETLPAAPKVTTDKGIKIRTPEAINKGHDLKPASPKISTDKVSLISKMALESIAPLKVRAADIKTPSSPSKVIQVTSSEKPIEKECNERKLSSLQMFCKQIQKQHDKKSKKSLRNALLKKRVISEKEDDDDEWEDVEEDENVTIEKIQKPPAKIFSKIESMSFASADGALTFKCLVKECEFETSNNEMFLDHLEDNHMNVKWTGFCAICSKLVSSKQRSIVFELMHMREDHILKEKLDVDEKKVEKEVKVEVPAVQQPTDVEEKISVVTQVLPQATIKTPPVKPVTLKMPAKQAKVMPSASASKKPQTSIIKPKPLPEASPKSVEKKTNSTQAQSKPIQKPPVPPKIETKPSSAGEDSSGIKKHIIMKPPAAAVKLEEKSEPLAPSKPEEAEKNSKEKEEKSVLSPIDLLRPFSKRKVKKYVVPATQMLSTNALVATYKCMAKLCSFYTSDVQLFENHLNFHENFTPADKDYMFCSYCDFQFCPNSKVNDLIKHINIEHKYDKFACSYCFYRSCANFNVLAHQKIYHNTKQRMIIELNSNKARDYAKEFESIIQMRSKVISAIPCAICKVKFFTFHELRVHINSHDSKAQVKCTKCWQICNNENMIRHLTHCYKLGFYQCLYCPFGTSTFEAVCDHVADCHPSCIPVFCERSKQRGETSKSPVTLASLIIKHISQLVDSRIVQKANVSDVQLRNEENVAHLGGNVVIKRSSSDSYVKVRLSTPKEIEKKEEGEDKQSSLQIQSVFSLSERKKD